ncbi:uncharacterized protein [Arachis hypogaea]|uniref:uncharacterized protein n=1 Tax=Arachis hypogaea TaxID=3818 RepID=UPI003B20BDA3
MRIQGQLFKRGLNQPLLKCLHPDQTDYVLREVHEGCCGHHIGGKALARKLVRARYYWPSMMTDSKAFVKKCKKCQENTNFHKAPPAKLSFLLTIRAVGSRPAGAIPCRTWPGQILDRSHRLLHQVGRSQATGEHILGQLSKVYVEASDNQVEAANKVILRGLKRRLDHKKGGWTDELASVLWSYRTTKQSSTREIPFRLTYGIDAIILVEIGEPSPRLLLGGVEEAMEKDLIDEAREMAHLSETALKQRMALRYNAKVLKREFEKNDLVLRCNDVGLPTLGEGKLAPNWEGPYKIKEVIGRGAYRLE